MLNATVERQELIVMREELEILRAAEAERQAKERQSDMIASNEFKGCEDAKAVLIETIKSGVLDEVLKKLMDGSEVLNTNKE